MKKPPIFYNTKSKRDHVKSSAQDLGELRSRFRSPTVFPKPARVTSPLRASVFHPYDGDHRSLLGHVVGASRKAKARSYRNGKLNTKS